MANATNNAPAFVPLLSAQQAAEHLSPIVCANRDVMRRAAVRVLTMTPEELVAQAKASPEEHAARCQIVADLHEYVAGEATNYAAALDRLLWASCEAGIAPLAEDVEGLDASSLTEGDDHA